MGDGLKYEEMIHLKFRATVDYTIEELKTYWEDVERMLEEMEANE